MKRKSLFSTIFILSILVVGIIPLHALAFDYYYSYVGGGYEEKTHRMSATMTNGHTFSQTVKEAFNGYPSGSEYKMYHYYIDASNGSTTYPGHSNCRIALYGKDAKTYYSQFVTTSYTTGFYRETKG